MRCALSTDDVDAGYSRRVAMRIVNRLSTFSIGSLVSFMNAPTSKVPEIL